jgi:hypothetical protein
MDRLPPVVASSPATSAEQGGLATAGRADKHGEFTIIDGQIDTVNDVNAAKGLLHLMQFKTCHDFPSSNPGSAGSR